MNRQVRELKSAGVEEVITEREHGNAKVKQKHLRLKILGSSIDCRNGGIGPMNQAFFQMRAVFAELELSIIRVRVKSGMANAKSKGKKIGKPHTTKDSIPAIFYKRYPAFASGNMNVSKLTRICDLSRPTVINT